MPTCTCSNCSQHLEFDAAHAGTVITCPTCNFLTCLAIPAGTDAPKVPPPRKRPPPRNPTNYNKPQVVPAVPKTPDTAKPKPQSPTPEEMLRRLNAEAHDSPLTPLPDTRAGRSGAALDEVIPALAAAGAAARAASPARLSCQAEALERIRAATCYGPLRKFFSTVESILFVFAASVAMGGIVAAVDASEKGSPGLVVAALAGGAVGALVLGFVARAGKQAALLMVDIADCQIQQVARHRAEATEQ